VLDLPYDIAIDSHEKFKDFFIAELIDKGINPKIESLPVGDFLIFGKTEEDATLIERKTASDFLSSLEGKKKGKIWVKGRLWDQLKRMKESGVKDRWILLEGSLTSRLTAYRKKGFTKQRVWGALEGIKNWGTGIQRVKNKDESVEWLIYKIEKKRKPKKEFALRASPHKSMTLREKKLYLLEGLPGIGPKTAKAILREFKTIKKFINKVDDVDRISGIGKTIKKEIMKIID